MIGNPIIFHHSRIWQMFILATSSYSVTSV